MTVSEKSIGGYGLLNENWLFGITNTESKKHRADCFREIGERTFSFFLDTAVEQGFEDREGRKSSPRAPYRARRRYGGPACP